MLGFGTQAEELVYQTINEGIITRKDIFVTTKIIPAVVQFENW